MAIKPNDGTYAENAIKHGVSGLNIDGARIGKKEGDRTKYGVNRIERSKNNNVCGEQSGRIQFNGTQGRFPANIILDEEAGKLLDKQSGTLKSFKSKNNYKGTQGSQNIFKGSYGKDTGQLNDENYVNLEGYEKTESTRYVGRAIVALLSDPDIM